MSLTNVPAPQAADDPGTTSVLDPSLLSHLGPMPMNLDNPSDDAALTSFTMGNPQALPDNGLNDLNGLDGFNDFSMPPPPNPNTQAQAFANPADENNHISNLGAPGAGPLPVGGVSSQSNLPGGSTLTEFTKRRNWPAKVVEELKDFLQILDANGRIRFVSPSTSALTGYSTEDIAGKFLKDFIHPDDVGVFVAELNDSIATGNPLRLFYRFRKKDGSYAIFEAVGHAHIAAARYAPNPRNQSPFCQAVFIMARPYPTKNVGLLDSFLEHKIENERLRRRIAGLRREEEVDNEESQKQWIQSEEGRSDVTPSETTRATSSAGMPGVYPQQQQQQQQQQHHHHPQQQQHNSQQQHYPQQQHHPQHQQPLQTPTTDGSMQPPPQPVTSAAAENTPLNVALTREALEGVANSRPDSLKDKMARFEGSHADTIEMLTGLRYIEGERSKGITTGNHSPTLVKGDAGIAIPVDRDPRTGEKKKKLKTTEEYVCTDCGTLDSPEWRKGPSGPKTLCNACGLRWAKKEKKNRHGSNSNNNGGGSSNHSVQMKPTLGMG